MAKTKAKTTRLFATKPPGTTRLSSDVSKPQPTAPGDAPYDTWDSDERATAVTPDKKTAAAAGYQTVNAVVPAEKLVTPSPTPGKRVETYTQRGPDGKVVTVQHDLDTGETKIVPDSSGSGQSLQQVATVEQTPEVDDTNAAEGADESEDEGASAPDDGE